MSGCVCGCGGDVAPVGGSWLARLWADVRTLDWIDWARIVLSVVGVAALAWLLRLAFVWAVGFSPWWNGTVLPGLD